MITPNEKQEGLGKALDVPELYFKREDLHPLDSHKGRSIPKMIELNALEGWKHFAISSSGNAALSASKFIKEHNQKNSEKLSLNIYIGERINKEKEETLRSLADEYIRIEKEKRPLQKLFEIAKFGNIKSLRQSTDDSALLGYLELAHEISSIPNISAVFIPTSSGTTAQALGEAFQKAGRKIEIHLAQTEFCHPLSKEFHRGKTAPASIADAIVDKVVHRKARVIELVKNSGGSGWILSDEEITNAQEIAKKETGLSISPNSALSIAALQKALHAGWKPKGSVACLITGK